MDTDDIKVVHEFPRDVREIENTFIPLADGVQLAARIIALSAIRLRWGCSVRFIHGEP